MDFISHGLWGGLSFGQKNKKSFWLAFFFGVCPDLLSFGIFSAMSVLGLVSGPDWSAGPPPVESIPEYVHILYNFTHSLVPFAVIFGIVWLLRKKPLYELLAWPLHILVDIPTHSTEFFPTPFLWPFVEYRVNGIPWSDPHVFFSNWIFLIILYLYFFVYKRRRAPRSVPNNEK